MIMIKLGSSEPNEEDFMSDKFLKQPDEASSKSKTNSVQIDHQDETYSQRRKRKILEATKLHQTKKSRVQMEIEAREEGLNRNLIQPSSSTSNLNSFDNLSNQSHGKAVKMMLKMGYQPGSSLGLKPSDSSSNHPIKIVPKSDRSGIGIKKPDHYQLTRLFLSEKEDGRFSNLSEEELEQRQKFINQSRHRFDGQKLDRFLSRASRTCEDLDRRRGLESNLFWIDSSSAHQVDHQDLSTLDRLISTEDQLDPQASMDPQIDPQDHSNWLALDPSIRLSCILEYLRQEYFYCMWCGCQYESSEDLSTECPGEEEDDH